jgi:LemA protein
MIQPSSPSFVGAPVRASVRRGAISRGLALGLGCLALVLGGVLIAALMAGGTYNSLVARQERVTQAWAEVQNQYKRRFDLIPNLVETVKGAADFEQETLTKVTEARASVGRAELPRELPTDPAQLQAYLAAQQQLGSALSRLLVVAEQYPQLRASQSFLSLQDQLEGTENRISVAREDYTVAVRDYNAARRSFPANLIAGTFGFEAVPQLEVAPEEQTTPRVDFGK